MKSETCFNQKTGSPLSVYNSEDSARSGAEYIKQAHGTDLVPYHCNRCDKWHLSPAARQTPSSTCHSCRDSGGRRKESYRSHDDARRRADILQSEQGANLRVYQCPSGTGWHLTKSRGW